MNVNQQATRPIALAENGWQVQIIDQTKLPHLLTFVTLSKVNDAATAIAEMQVRGAPLIGATAAYGIALAMRDDNSDDALRHARNTLLATRPTAVNLRWAVDTIYNKLQALDKQERQSVAYAYAADLCEQDVSCNRAIGEHGLRLIRETAATKSRSTPVNILTHCNAGWLATVDRGTALAPIYAAQEAGIDCHVWVDETRPRNQGAQLTAWELQQQNIPHTVIADNAGGHLMQVGEVDLCIVGSDRTIRNGDVCNKIGTYLKALAAHDNNVPFYVALPSNTIDWECDDAARIPIESRDQRELTHIVGKDRAGQLSEVQLTPDNSPAANPAFDVTPGRLVSGLITERGCCAASAEGLLSLFPERV